jgi:hypothetical protein
MGSEVQWAMGSEVQWAMGSEVQWAMGSEVQWSMHLHGQRQLSESNGALVLNQSSTLQEGASKKK